MKRILLTILLLLALAGNGWGATHTVCASGCDHTTIAAAEADATCDTVNVATGTYNESNPIFTAAKTWVAVDGDGTVTITNSGVQTYAAAMAGNSNAISIRGFVFDGAGTKTDALQVSNNGNNKTLTYCTFKGGTTNLLKMAGASSGMVVSHNTFSGTPSQSAIYGSNPSGTFDSNTFSHTSARAFYADGDTGAISITNNTLNCALSNRAIGLLGAGTITVTGNSGTIVGNSTGPNSFVSIATAGKNGAVTISNNTITLGATALPPVGSGIAITAGGHAVTISNNTLTFPGTAQTTSAIQVQDQATPIISGNTLTFASTNNVAGGIKVQSTGTEVGAVQVINNTIITKQTAGQAILVGTDTTSAGANKIDGAIITGNKIYSDLGANNHNLEYGYNKNGTVARNYVYGGKYGIVIKGDETYTSGGVYYNVLVDQEDEGIRVKGVKDLPVYNNTLYLSSGRTITNGLLYITINADSAGATSTGTIAKNNIFYNQLNQCNINIDANSATGFVADTNIHYPIRTNIDATTYSDLATWNAVSGIGTDIEANPLFKSTTDFRLQSGSPARKIVACADSVWNGVANVTDYAGKKITDGSGNCLVQDIDAGAYQYSGGRSVFRIGGKWRSYSN